MIVLFLILFFLFLYLYAVERDSAGWILRRLTYEARCDLPLAEPEQPITLISQTENRGWIPALYVHITESLPPEATLLADEEWIRENTRRGKTEIAVSDVTALLPHRRRTSELRFTLPRRGWYRLGRATIGAGDFLGLKEEFRRDNTRLEVVVMPRRCEIPAITQVLGGFLGDISVRRFILEDPVLAIGFREYTGREPMKAIAWNQTARNGALMVKQYDHTVDASVSVILNTEGGSEEDIERCYSITRTVCEELERKGIPYEFRTNGDLDGPVESLSFVAEGLGQQHLSTILYGLGRGNCRALSGFEKLVSRASKCKRSNLGYILITPPLTEEQAKLAARLRSEGSTLCVLTGEGEEAAA